MAKHERIDPIIVWENGEPRRKKDETVVPFPGNQENTDQFVRVLEPVTGGRPLRITQVSSGFGNPSPCASLHTCFRTAA